MSLSRRGFFGMLAGMATSPLFGQKVHAGSFRPAKTNGTFHETVAHPAMSPGEAKRLWEHYNRIFVWNYTPGVLWWSKENS